MTSAIVLIANGTEEIEFSAAFDVLKRADIDVQVLSVGSDSESIVLSRGMKVLRDAALEKQPDDLLLKADAVVLPGGLKGTEAFENSKEVGKLLENRLKAKHLVALICASTRILKTYKDTVGKINVTGHPSVSDELQPFSVEKTKPAVYDEKANVITSRGPGTAVDFALCIVEKLKGKEISESVRSAIISAYE